MALRPAALAALVLALALAACDAVAPDAAPLSLADARTPAQFACEIVDLEVLPSGAVEVYGSLVAETLTADGPGETRTATRWRVTGPFAEAAAANPEALRGSTCSGEGITRRAERAGLADCIRVEIQTIRGNGLAAPVSGGTLHTVHPDRGQG